MDEHELLTISYIRNSKTYVVFDLFENKKIMCSRAVFAFAEMERIMARHAWLQEKEQVARIREFGDEKANNTNGGVAVP